MSNRSARRRLPRDQRARHLMPPAMALGEAINAPPVPTRPKMTSRKWATFEIERRTPEQQAAIDDQRRRDAADRLWVSFALRRRVDVPAVPIDELEAWLGQHAPKTLERMRAMPKPRRGAGG